MQAEKFVWKAGAQFPVDAKTAVDTIHDLQQSLGKDTITAKELLDASRNEGAPLHSCFEWDDTVAAEKYRVEQARHIINSIEIKFVDTDYPAHLKQTRYMVNTVCVAPKAQGEFATINVAFTNENYRTAVLKNALHELRSFQSKYSRYQELSGVIKAIDDFGDTFK